MKKTNTILAALFTLVITLGSFTANAGGEISLIRLLNETAALMKLPVASVEGAILADLARTGVQGTSIAALEGSLSQAEKSALIAKLSKLQGPSAALAKFSAQAKLDYTQAVESLAAKNALGNAEGAGSANSLTAPNEAALAQQKEELLTAFEKTPMNSEQDALAITGQMANDALTTLDNGVPTITAKTCNQNKLSLKSFLNLQKLNNRVALATQKARQAIIAKTASMNQKSLATLKRIQNCSEELGGAALLLAIRDVLFAGAQDVTIAEAAALGSKVSANCAYNPNGALVARGVSAGKTWGDLEQRVQSGTCSI